jgi:hypothetical protein
MIRLNGRPVRGFALGDDTTPPSTPEHHASVVFKAAVAGAAGAAFGAGMSYADKGTINGSSMAYGAVTGVVGALVAMKMK